jgi:hypothetical protein
MWQCDVHVVYIALQCWVKERLPVDNKNTLGTLKDKLIISGSIIDPHQMSSGRTIIDVGVIISFQAHISA